MAVKRFIVHLVFEDVFQGDWKEAGSIGKLEKHEEADLAALNKAYAELSPIYVALRDILTHEAYGEKRGIVFMVPQVEVLEVDELKRMMSQVPAE